MAAVSSETSERFYQTTGRMSRDISHGRKNIIHGRASSSKCKVKNGESATVPRFCVRSILATQDI